MPLDIYASLKLHAETKKKRSELPVHADCNLRYYIGHYGFAEIDIYSRKTKQHDAHILATLLIYDADDLEMLGNAFIALAKAMRAADTTKANQ